MNTDDGRDGPVTLDHHAHIRGPFLHGTKALLSPGDELVAGYNSNFQASRISNHVYFTTDVETAAWGAQLPTALAGDDGHGHLYEVTPTGAFEDDPNVTDKKFPGNPTRSYRSREPLRVVREVADWPPHPPEVLQQMLDNLERLRAEGRDVIED